MSLTVRLVWMTSTPTTPAGHAIISRQQGTYGRPDFVDTVGISAAPRPDQVELIEEEGVVTAARAPIFDVAERVEGRPSDHVESTFDFLNRVAGDHWAHARDLIQAWADGLSGPDDYLDLRQRLRSRDDDQFRSAFLELYLHESLIRAGYTVVVHPAVPGTSRRPDFYAERAGTGLYVEAIAPGTSPQAKAAAMRRGVLFDTVNRLGDPNFMLWLSRLEEGPNPPASARLRSDVRRWLSDLNPDDYPDLHNVPEWHWAHNGWAVSFKAIPKRAGARGGTSNERAIGVYGHTEASFIDDAPTIRNALVSKHHAYGDLGAPFVVAIGTYMHDSDRWHSTNALYGHEALQITTTPEGVESVRPIRKPDGYFGTSSSWQNRNVSGVLLVNQLMPYSLPRVEATLWQHPDPLHPLPASLGIACVSLALRGQELVETPAPLSAEGLFGLPDPWPPGDAWFQESNAPQVTDG